MSKTQLQENNDKLLQLITELQEKTVNTEYEIITIFIPPRTSDININYSLSKITSAYGTMKVNVSRFNKPGLILGINNNELYQISDVFVEESSNSVATVYSPRVNLSTVEVTYKDGVMSAHLAYTTYDMSYAINVILVNDPSEKAISS